MMPDKKLTDNEIVKALECCIKAKTVEDCETMRCPLSLGNYQGCKYVDNENGLYKNALDLINRLQEENSNLQEKNSNLTSDLISLQNDLTCLQAEKEQYKANSDSRQTNEYKNIDIAHIKAEAYKECVEKVKEEINKHSYGALHKTVINYKLDNLLKEMVGDTDA